MCEQAEAGQDLKPWGYEDMVITGAVAKSLQFET